MQSISLSAGVKAPVSVMVFISPLRSRSEQVDEARAEQLTYHFL